MATERPDGIEMVDALPEGVAGEPAAEDSTADLSRGQGNRPSMDDALVTSAGSSFSPIQAVLKASEEPLEYLVRSNLEDDEINALILDNSLRHYAIQGRINPSLDSFLFVTMRGQPRRGTSQHGPRYVHGAGNRRPGRCGKKASSSGCRPSTSTPSSRTGARDKTEDSCQNPKTAPRQRTKAPADPHAARELFVTIQNNWPDLHRQQEVPIWKNLLQKQKKGTYDREKAVKLFMYLVDEGARRYGKDFEGKRGIPSYMNKSTRELTARRLRDYFEDEAKAGSITLEGLK